MGDSTAGLFCCGRLWYWTILRWENLLLDFFAVGDSAGGLSSYWTNEQASLLARPSSRWGTKIAHRFHANEISNFCSSTVGRATAARF